MQSEKDFKDRRDIVRKAAVHFYSLQECPAIKSFRSPVASSPKTLTGHRSNQKEEVA